MRKVKASKLNLCGNPPYRIFRHKHTNASSTISSLLVNYIFLIKIRYIEHYSQWLPSQHYHISEVKLALSQLIGAGGPTAIQTITEEKLNFKIELSQLLLKLFTVIAAGNYSI